MKYTRLAVFAAAVLFTATPLFASAAVMQAGKIVTIPKDQALTENAYIAGGQVIISAPAAQDVVAAGGNVTMTAPIGGSVLVAGGSINILNDVKGSVRALGGQVAISGAVGGDVVVAGGTLTIMPGSSVAGDVLVAGGTVDIEGAVAGQVRAYGANVTVNSPVTGPIQIMAGKSVTFGSKAAFAGAVSYKAPHAAMVAEGAQIGNQVTFTAAGTASKKMGAGFLATLLGILTIVVLIKLIAVLVAALALEYSMPRFAHRLATSFVGSFWKSALIGFIALVVTPIACIVLLVSVVGFYLAFLLGILYALALVATTVSLVIFSGALLSHWIKKEIRVNWFWTLIGAVIVALLWFIPVVGWITFALLFFAAFGVIVMSLKHDAEEKMS